MPPNTKPNTTITTTGTSRLTITATGWRAQMRSDAAQIDRIRCMSVLPQAATGQVQKHVLEAGALDRQVTDAGGMLTKRRADGSQLAASVVSMDHDRLAVRGGVEACQAAARQ